MALYLSRRDALGRFLRARLGDSEEAEDVLQELYLRVSRTAPSEDRRNAAAYLYKMALNLARDRRRARNRAGARDTGWVQARYEVAGVEPVLDQPNAEAALDARQRLEAVRRALEELSPQCRRVFEMHKFEGLSHQEVAVRAGITRSTVEKHMNTALKHLIRRLGRD
ncbi:MAG TPA: sigma-70 family RNA polymerase sigma factor [Rhizomicrobium sp.]|nr:sigma-70 family RNA polymerase sigma factor [Rhizomicrobium sp.]